MFNILLDPLPDEYEGYLIRTDYRIGMQLNLCYQDADIDDGERAYIAMSLLFGSGTPPVDLALEALDWFMRCGAPKRTFEGTGNTTMWFDYDASRIYASFRQTFGVELHKARLHWFEFCAMLDSVDESSSLSNAIQIRSTDTGKMQPQERARYERLKRNLSPPPIYSQEEQELIDDFFSRLNH